MLAHITTALEIAGLLLITFGVSAGFAMTSIPAACIVGGVLLIAESALVVKFATGGAPE